MTIELTRQEPITILGSGGWIGLALVDALRRKGRLVHAVDRESLPSWLSVPHCCGLVIYAIGLTADFRRRPYETIEAHVSLLNSVLQNVDIKQFLFLSSTRVYARSDDTSETCPLPCLSSDPSDLYNLSKLLGESLVLQDPRPGWKVVRLSNVVGPRQPANTFLGSLLEDARSSRLVTIHQPPDTIKNYVKLADVVSLLPMIAENGKHRIYNLGSPFNISHSEVGAWLKSHGVAVRFDLSNVGSSATTFPPLSITRLTSEFEPPGYPFLLRYPL